MKPYFVKCSVPEVELKPFPRKNNPVNLNLVAFITRGNTIQNTTLYFCSTDGTTFCEWHYNTPEELESDYNRIVNEN